MWLVSSFNFHISNFEPDADRDEGAAQIVRGEVQPGKR